MAQDNAYHFTEGLWITAAAPDRVPLAPLPGGGGPGFGGWGLSEGRPRGTGQSSQKIRQELSLRRVLGEEQAGTSKYYEDLYLPLIRQLPAKIEAERKAISQQANASGGTPVSKLAKQLTLTTSLIHQKRKNYLANLPKAVDFYGAMPFYKRADSFMSRINDPGAFKNKTGEAFGKELWTRHEASLDTAYKLHLEAETIHRLSADLPGLASQIDTAEAKEANLNLPQAIKRRTEQINHERQICFDCLPNFLQHELAKSTSITSSHTVVQALLAYLASAANLIGSTQRNTPTFKTSNPQIKSPLSKPQLEALHHLVAEQAIRRAGPLWKEYHSALTQTESIRYLQWFSAILKGLHQRALHVEALQKRHEVELAAARQAKEAALKAEIERKAKEQARKAEAERKANEAAQKAEAERKAKEAAQKAEEERKAREAERQRNSFNAYGTSPASLPLVLPIGSATFAISQSTYASLQTGIRAIVAELATAIAPTIGQILVGVLSLAWPSALGNSERRYLISTPLIDLSPPNGPDLATLAMASASVNLPYLLSGSEHGDKLSLFIEPGGRAVPVRAAKFDSERHVYSLALDNPQRILTWTPASAPGSEQGSSTSLPPAPPGTIVYTGSSLNPVTKEQESYPALDPFDQERLIVTFPADSGLPPILVVFKSPRYESGIVTGAGAQVTRVWLGESTRDTGAPIPAQIADLLRGREFKNFDSFRREFWKTIARDPELSKQFTKQNLIRMRDNGYAPKVRQSDVYGLHASFVLHHVKPISEDGAVYDIDNIRIVTPIAHKNIHYGENP